MVIALLVLPSAPARRPPAPRTVATSGRSLTLRDTSHDHSGDFRPLALERPLELHAASEMPIIVTLALQSLVALSAVGLVTMIDHDGAVPVFIGLLAVTLGLYAYHCSTCYPVALSHDEYVDVHMFAEEHDGLHGQGQ